MRVCSSLNKIFSHWAIITEHIACLTEHLACLKCSRLDLNDVIVCNCTCHNSKTMFKFFAFLPEVLLNHMRLYSYKF